MIIIHYHNTEKVMSLCMLHKYNHEVVPTTSVSKLKALH